MNASQPPDKDSSTDSGAILRRMGMVLAVFGSAVTAIALADCRQAPNDGLTARCLLMLVLGTALLIAGLYIWSHARKAGK